MISTNISSGYSAPKAHGSNKGKQYICNIVLLHLNQPGDTAAATVKVLSCLLVGKLRLSPCCINSVTDRGDFVRNKL